MFVFCWQKLKVSIFVEHFFNELKVIEIIKTGEGTPSRIFNAGWTLFRAMVASLDAAKTARLNGSSRTWLTAFEYCALKLPADKSTKPEVSKFIIGLSYLDIELTGCIDFMYCACVYQIFRKGESTASFLTSLPTKCVCLRTALTKCLDSQSGWTGEICGEWRSIINILNYKKAMARIYL